MKDIIARKLGTWPLNQNKTKPNTTFFLVALEIHPNVNIQQNRRVVIYSTDMLSIISRKCLN